MQLPYEKKFKKKIKIKKQGKDTFANATKYNNYFFQDERSNVFVYARTQIHRYTSKHSLFGCYSHCNPYLRLIMQSNLKIFKLIWGG